MGSEMCIRDRYTVAVGMEEARGSTVAVYTVAVGMEEARGSIVAVYTVAVGRIKHRVGIHHRLVTSKLTWFSSALA